MSLPEANWSQIKLLIIIGYWFLIFRTVGNEFEKVKLTPQKGSPKPPPSFEHSIFEHSIFEHLIFLILNLK